MLACTMYCAVAGNQGQIIWTLRWPGAAADGAVVTGVGGENCRGGRPGGAGSWYYVER